MLGVEVWDALSKLLSLSCCTLFYATAPRGELWHAGLAGAGTTHLLKGFCRGKTEQCKKFSNSEEAGKQSGESQLAFFFLFFFFSVRSRSENYQVHCKE